MIENLNFHSIYNLKIFWPTLPSSADREGHYTMRSKNCWLNNYKNLYLNSLFFIYQT